MNESFNGKFRDECLVMEWFGSEIDAKNFVESWRRHHNDVRPHASIENLTPEELNKNCHNQCWSCSLDDGVSKKVGR